MGYRDATAAYEAANVYAWGRQDSLGQHDTTAAFAFAHTFRAAWAGYLSEEVEVPRGPNLRDAYANWLRDGTVWAATECGRCGRFMHERNQVEVPSADLAAHPGLRRCLRCGPADKPPIRPETEPGQVVVVLPPLSPPVAIALLDTTAYHLAGVADLVTVAGKGTSSPVPEALTDATKKLIDYADRLRAVHAPVPTTAPAASPDTGDGEEPAAQRHDTPVPLPWQRVELDGVTRLVVATAPYDTSSDPETWLALALNPQPPYFTLLEVRPDATAIREVETFHNIVPAIETYSDRIGGY